MVETTIWKIEPHTEAKHAILKKYLSAWLPILTRHIPKVVFIDGFAGPGEYIGGKDGSPIIAINSVIDHKIPITSKIIFLFVEKYPDRYEFLVNKLKKMVLSENIKYECKCGEFADVVGNILDDISKQKAKLAPTFVFIDPFGFKGIPFEIIEKIMKNNKCEVLITFMFEAINRFLDLPGNEQILNGLFGTEKWKEAKKKDPRGRLEVLHGLYREQLEKIARYVISFKMVNKFNKAEYFLFFATNHILGLKKMKGSMWNVDSKGGFEFSDATYSPHQTLLFKLEPNFAMLKKLIVEKYKGKKIDITELEEFIVAETPFRETHFKKQILIPMENKKEIEIMGERKRIKTYPAGVIIKFL